MSLTELRTAVEASAPHPSLTIRARSPHPHEPPSPKCGDQGPDDVEMVGLGRNPSKDGASSTIVPAPSDPPPPPSAKARRKATIQFLALCWSMFTLGWNDGTTGPLLPRIQSVYNVGFAIVSLIFVFACLGFLLGAFSLLFLTERFGFGKTLVLGASLPLIGYSIQSAAPPFPAFVMGFTITGFGLALQDATANGFVACFKDNPETKMGILHAVYVEVPNRCRGPRGTTRLDAILATAEMVLPIPYIDRNRSFECLDTPCGLPAEVTDECLMEIGHYTAHHDEPGANDSNINSKYRQVFRLKMVHLLAFFILVYVGVEVTIGGWIVTFIINVRHGGPSSGYISSGFFGGLTLGRVALLWVGEHRVMFLYTILAIGLELVVWFVPSLISGAIAVSFVGMLLGPIYPIVMNHASRILPPRLLTGCIGWIAGFGQAGSALIPFMTGALASSKGIQSLQPLLVAMMGFMLVLWFFVPNSPRRID